MATAPQLIEEPLPSRGFSDITPSRMPPGYGVDAHDIVLDEEQVVRPRAGWEAEGSIASVAGVVGWEVPVGYTYDNSQDFIDVFTQAVLTYAEYNTGWSGVNPAVGFNGTDSKAFGYVHDFNSAISATKVTDGTDTRNMLPLGKPVSIEGEWYAVSSGLFSRQTRDLAGGTTSGIVMWAGATLAKTTNTITINNGSNTGTLGTGVSAGAYNNAYVVVSDGLAGHRYAYRVLSSSGTDIIIEGLYGLGDSITDVPNASADTLTVYPMGYMPSAPPATAITAWRGRLWAAGALDDAIIPGSSNGTFNSALSWSDSSNVQYWPRDNYLVLDSGGDIIAIQALGDIMLLWTRDQTWMLTGYDEDSFQVSLISGTVGCLGRAAVTVHQGVIFWMARDGVYYLNGTTPTRLNNPPAPRGRYRNFSFYAAELEDFGTFPWLESHNDYLLMSVERVVPAASRSGFTSPSYPRPRNYIVHVPSNSWSSWGRTDSAEYGHNPGLFFKGKNIPSGVLASVAGADVTHTLGACRFGVYNIENCWEHPYQVAGLSTPLYMDELFTGSGTTTTNSAVPATFTTRDFIVADGQTVRLQDVHVEHSCQDTSVGAACWTVTLDTDQDIVTTTLAVGNVLSRFSVFQNPPQPDVTQPGSNYHPEKYYTDRFTDLSFPTEGMVWRFKFVFTPTTTTGSGKINALRLKFTGKPTFLGRVDNTT